MEWHLSADCDWAVPRAGWLVVSGAPAWLTRQGDWADHVLPPGGVLVVAAGDRVRLGPWQTDGGPAPRVVYVAAQRVDWRFWRALASALWRRLALGLRAGAGALSSLARSAESMASRAQGCN